MGNTMTYGADAMIKNRKGQVMATTLKKQAVKPVAKKVTSKIVATDNGKTEPKQQIIAALLVSPEFSTHRVIKAIDPTYTGRADIKLLMEQYREHSAAANSGDMTRPEAMLINQATALQSLFTGLVEKALNQDHMPHLDGLMRMALRAQNQCRATLETLATIKSPPMIFAKQANINHGNQQVNNGIPAPRTEEIKNEPNQLLEVDHGSKTLDTRTTSATSRKNYAMAAVD